MQKWSFCGVAHVIHELVGVGKFIVDMHPLERRQDCTNKATLFHFLSNLGLLATNRFQRKNLAVDTGCAISGQVFCA